jgi:NitT/TauT family transport system substrate-binding protein
MFKASQLCSLEPEQTAQRLVEQGYASRYDYTLRTLQDIPYGAWRSFDSEDAMRFYSLRLREAGLINSAPQEIIAKGTDWRFVNEIKRELKV